MADNNDKDLEPETNLGEANIEGKNAAYFANLPSNVKNASQQNENAAASANYKAPKNFGKSAVLNAEQRKALRNKLAKGSKKVTPSKYSPKFNKSGNNTPKNSTGLLTNAEKFNFTRKKPKTNAHSAGMKWVIDPTTKETKLLPPVDFSLHIIQGWVPGRKLHNQPITQDKGWLPST